MGEHSSKKMKYTTIIKVIGDYVAKCGDYPKARALKYFKENKDNFQEESYDKGDDPTNTRPSPKGFLQKTQQELQKSINYKSDEKGAIEGYNTVMFTPLKEYLEYGMILKDLEDIYLDDVEARSIWDEKTDKYYELLPLRDKHNSENPQDWETKNVRVEKHIQLIDDAIDKSPVLQQDTVFYRWGRLDEKSPFDEDFDIEYDEYTGEGDHGIFNGFTGLTYNENVAKDLPSYARWGNQNYVNRYQIKVYAPKGTKGITLDPNCGGKEWQSEFLLKRNQKFVVLSRDDENMTAEILLYG